MTEDEAKKRKCCGPEGSGKPLDWPYPVRMCIGSECMAWRLAQKQNPEWKPSHGMMSTGWQRHPAEEPPLYIADPDHGYCGLAGRP